MRKNKQKVNWSEIPTFVDNNSEVKTAMLRFQDEIKAVRELGFYNKETAYLDALTYNACQKVIENEDDRLNFLLSEIEKESKIGFSEVKRAFAGGDVERLRIAIWMRVGLYYLAWRNRIDANMAKAEKMGLLD